MSDRSAKGMTRLAGLAAVLGLHGLVFAALGQLPAARAPAKPAPVYVSIIDGIVPPAPAPRLDPPPRQPRPPAPLPPPAVVAPPRPVVAEPAPVPAEAPRVEAPAAVAAAQPAPAPVPPAVAPAAPAAPAALPVAAARPPGPLALGGELEVVCSDRPPPSYPLAAKRRGVAGRVVLQVELDETGRVAAVSTLAGSGSRWLDEAARDAVVRWRCAAPQRNGVATRVLAKQTFIFSLEDA